MLELRSEEDEDTGTLDHQFQCSDSRAHVAVSFDNVLLNAVVSFYKLREDKRRIELERMKRHKQLLPLVPLERGTHLAFPRLTCATLIHRQLCYTHPPTILLG